VGDSEDGWGDQVTPGQILKDLFKKRHETTREKMEGPLTEKRKKKKRQRHERGGGDHSPERVEEARRVEQHCRKREGKAKSSFPTRKKGEEQLGEGKRWWGRTW